jgi:RNA polymerase primary sigma factor
LRPGLDLMELVSEGNITLMRAVESFDPHKGNRFSTYATLALMKGFARSVPQMLTRRSAPADDAAMSAVSDVRLADRMQNRLDREQVTSLLSRLDDQERRVLSAHYGLGEHPQPATLSEVAATLNLSRHHVHRIERSALAKLRAVGC